MVGAHQEVQCQRFFGRCDECAPDFLCDRHDGAIFKMEAYRGELAEVAVLRDVARPVTQRETMIEKIFRTPSQALRARRRFRQAWRRPEESLGVVRQMLVKEREGSAEEVQRVLERDARNKRNLRMRS